MTATAVNPPYTPARGLGVVVRRPGVAVPPMAPAAVLTGAPLAVPAPSLADQLHSSWCRVCLDLGPVDVMDDAASEFVAHVARAIDDELEDTAADEHAVDPELTAGQRRLLQSELPRLTRMLDDRRPGRLEAVLVLLDDLAQQAPAVDDVLEAERQRRRETAAARPTIALALVTNRAGGDR